ncbi:MAG: hypothetical protein AAGA54_19005 [Myxococcota bacterium]
MKSSLATLPILAALALPGCIIVADGSDGSDTDLDRETTVFDDDDDAGAPDPSTTGDPGPDPGGSDESGSESGDVDEPAPVCGENVLDDPGFESGTPSEAWSEVSALFGTPLCDGACSEDDSATPFSGDWWVWFGGVEESESASVTQRFSVSGDAAYLRFHVAVNASSGTGGDLFLLSIDDQELWSLSDADITEYGDYVEVEFDISDFADGQMHDLTFSAELGGDGLTNFFLDDVSVFACDDPVDEDGSTGGSTGGSSGGADGSTSGGMDDTDGDAAESSSSSSGSSSSSSSTGS